MGDQAESRNPGGHSPADGQNLTVPQETANGLIPTPTSPQSPTGFQVFQGSADGQNQAESRNPGGQSPTDGQILAGFQEIANCRIPTPINAQSPTIFKVFRSISSGFQGQIRDQEPAGVQKPADGQNPERTISHTPQQEQEPLKQLSNSQHML